MSDNNNNKDVLTTSQIAKLNEPLPIQFINKKAGLDYIPGHIAIDQANQIFGFNGWKSEVLSNEIILKEEIKPGSYLVVAKSTVKVWAAGTSHIGTGAHSSIGPLSRLGNLLEDVSKSADTDALKRALRNFGNQFGNGLYFKEEEGREDRIGYTVDGNDSDPVEGILVKFNSSKSVKILDKVRVENQDFINSLGEEDKKKLRESYKTRKKFLESTTKSGDTSNSFNF